MRKNFKIYILFLSLVFGSIWACSKEESGIPDVPVNIIIYASDPLFMSLNPIGGWIYHNGGSRGILIYRKSSEEFLAYDRHCPFQPENSCGKINIDVSNPFIAVDSCCTSKFFILDGSVNSGPAKRPLLRYNVSFDGNRLNVYN